MSDSPVSVVAGAVLSPDGSEVLLAKRHAHAHQGGKWEFPGGKAQPNETAPQTLMRELEEEVGIQVQGWQRLIRMPFIYPEFAMDFEVFKVTQWSGEPYGREGQEIRWAPVEQLREWVTPPASRPVIRALQLPGQYAISADPGEDQKSWLQDLSRTLENGVRLIQLRAHSQPTAAYEALAGEAIARVHAAGAQILLNAAPELAVRLGADGVHLTSARLQSLSQRPVPDHLWLGASCHNEEELDQAVRIGADFAVLSPVRDALGWERYAALLEKAALPVFALGGMKKGDEKTAVEYGGQGIAAIRSLWG